MRLFEILIYVIIIITLIGKLFLRKSNGRLFLMLPFAAAALIPVHLAFEGYRWQMVPAYVLAGLFMIVSVFLLATKKKHLINGRKLRAALNTAVLLLFCISAIFPLLLPIRNLPEPDGPYKVGTISMRLTDKDREEEFTEESGDLRSLLVTVYYPADTIEDLKKSTYWDSDGVTGKAYSINSGMGNFWYSHIKLMGTNSYEEAELSRVEESYPAIIYSPSFYGLGSENTILFEELASNGYIVFCITHTFESIVSVFPDGEAVYGSLECFQSKYDSNSQMEIDLYESFGSTDDEQTRAEIISEILTVDDQFNNMIRVRTEDLIFVIDEIERMNQENGIFNSKIDIERIGAVGWSFGGATAIGGAIEDPRLRAVVNIDGWPYGESFSNGLIMVPLLMIENGSLDDSDRIAYDMIYEKSANDVFGISVENTEHINFWDFPYFFDVYKYIGFWGPADAKTVNELHNIYTVGFFNEYLKGEEGAFPRSSDELRGIVFEEKQ